MWVALLLTLRAGLPRDCGLPASAQLGLQARHLGGIPAQQVEAVGPTHQRHFGCNNPTQELQPPRRPRQGGEVPNRQSRLAGALFEDGVAPRLHGAGQGAVLHAAARGVHGPVRQSQDAQRICRGESPNRRRSMGSKPLPFCLAIACLMQPQQPRTTPPWHNSSRLWP